MNATTERRIWIGCLAAYNAGRLHGEWVDADEEILVYRPDHYVGGTGQFTEYADARLMYDAGGKPMGVFPKRKQIGHDVTGARVFAR